MIQSSSQLLPATDIQESLRWTEKLRSSCFRFLLFRVPAVALITCLFILIKCSWKVFDTALISCQFYSAIKCMISSSPITEVLIWDRLVLFNSVVFCYSAVTGLPQFVSSLSQTSIYKKEGQTKSGLVDNAVCAFKILKQADFFSSVMPRVAGATRRKWSY